MRWVECKGEREGERAFINLEHVDVIFFETKPDSGLTEVYAHCHGWGTEHCLLLETFDSFEKAKHYVSILLGSRLAKKELIESLIDFKQAGVGT